ncbi:uncharacterized protein KZ484_025614 [Pholidichthys leucotaenia]
MGNVSSFTLSVSQNSTPLSSEGLLVADIDNDCKNKGDAVTKTHGESQEKEGTNLQFNSWTSDITPGQRPQQQCDFSAGSVKSTLPSKQSLSVVGTVKSKTANSVMSEKGSEIQLTPMGTEDFHTISKKLKKHIIFTVEQTPTKQDSPPHQTQSKSLHPSPLNPTMSPDIKSSGMQDRKQDPEFVSKSVSEIAARLCNSLQFPPLKGNLVSESREVLLKTLQEKHGPWLQENLLEVQRCPNVGMHPKNTDLHQDQKPPMMDEDELSLQGSRHFNWKCNPQPRQNPKEATDWVKSTVETSSGVMDDILHPSFSPQFCMDVESSGPSAINVFASSPTFCWEEKPSVSDYWKHGFKKLQSERSPMFDSSENSFTNYSRAFEVKNCKPQHCDGDFQCLFSLRTRPNLEEPMHFPKEPKIFKPDKYSFASSLPAQIYSPQETNPFQPFRQFSHPSPLPHFRSSHTSMVHFPPSYMIERETAHPPSSFLSPEHWSFPPMKLY